MRATSTASILGLLAHPLSIFAFLLFSSLLVFFILSGSKQQLSSLKQSDASLQRFVYQQPDIANQPLIIQAGTRNLTDLIITLPPPPLRSLFVHPLLGNDLGLGSSSSPLRTIQEALQRATPGTTINLQAGTYSEQLTTVNAGTAQQPIVLQPDTNAQPVMDLQWSKNAITIEHPYYVLKNLEIKNFNEGIRIHANNTQLLDNHIHHGKNECVRLRHFANNNLLHHNTIHNCGHTTPTQRLAKGNGEGIYIGTAPEQRSRNNGLPDSSSSNLIINNTIFAATEGVDIKEDSSYTIIAYNTLFSTTDPDSGVINIRADNNYIYSNNITIAQGAGIRIGGDFLPTFNGKHSAYGQNNTCWENIFSGTPHFKEENYYGCA